MKIMNSFAVAVLGAVVFALPAQAATISIAGTPNAFTFDESSTVFQPTAVTASQVVTFDRVQLGPDEELTSIEIVVSSDFTTSLTITNNSGGDAGIFFSAQAIQSVASPNDSETLSDPMNSLTVGAGGAVPNGQTVTFSDSVLGLSLRADLDVGDFIATGPGQTVDVLVTAVFNVTSVNLVNSTFQPIPTTGFSFDWNFVKNDSAVTAIAETRSTLVPVPSSVIIFALGLVAVGFRLRKLSA